MPRCSSPEDIDRAVSVTRDRFTTRRISETGGDDVLIGRIIIFTSGNAKHEAARITDYTDSTGTMTVTTLAVTPAATDTFVIV